jgi:glycosyltransferase involved in cell wall biosynthesis
MLPYVDAAGRRPPNPLVTIVTPTYNRAEFLGDVIESVRTQDYPQIEHIVLDDGSTDGTQEVIKKFAPHIRAIFHPNAGETATVNRGFSLATGDIIGVVNSDDPLLPGAVTAAVATLISDPQLLVTYPDWVMIDESSNVVGSVTTDDFDYVDMVRKHHCVPGPGAFFTAELVRVLHGRDPQFRFVADFDFWLRAGLLGPFHRIPRTLATFRLHPGGASSNAKGPEMADEHVRLIKKLFATPNLPPGVLAVRREAFGSAYYVAGAVMGNESSPLRKKYFASALLMTPRKRHQAYADRLAVIRGELRYGWLRHLAALARSIVRRLPGVHMTSK